MLRMKERVTISVEPEAFDASEVDSLSEERAKEVGLRLGKRAQRDIADAHVVCCAVEHAAAIATSDPTDMQSLTEPGERVASIAV